MVGQDYDHSCSGSNQSHWPLNNLSLVGRGYSGNAEHIILSYWEHHWMPKYATTPTATILCISCLSEYTALHVGQEWARYVALQ